MSDVTIHYLQMTQPPPRRAWALPSNLTLDKVTPPDEAVNQRFYREVGGLWSWVDRCGWSLDQWRGYAERDALSTWVARCGGDEVGYAELEQENDGNVQLCYFGLLPQFIGRGLGGLILTQVIEIAWSLPDTRHVWVHTCTKDHPNALANYRARGFEIYRTEVVARR